MAKIKKIIFIFIFIFCLFIQVIPVIRSGLYDSQGISFWGPNGHDGIWHLSLINHIQNPFSIDMPIFSGEKLKNYHPFFNVFISLIAKITSLDSSLLLFQIFPLISVSLFLLLSFKVGSALSKNYLGGIYLMIFNSINNSFGWIVSLVRFKNLEGESLFWAMQSPSNQINPPLSLSFLLILYLIYLLITNQTVLSKLNQTKIILILLFLPVIKVYSAIPAFIIFGFYVLKNKKYFSTLIVSFVLSTLLFLQFNSVSGSLLVFKPFWFINSLIESPDRFYLPKIANARYVFQSNPIIIVGIYLLTTSIFLLGNFAWRILSLISLFKKNNWFLQSILVSVIILTSIPLLFIQAGTSWNTIQFIYYALFLLNISLSLVLSQKKYLWLAIIIIISLLPPLFGSLPQFLGNPAPANIPLKEVDCLKFLSLAPKGNILTYPFDKFQKNLFKFTPLPLYVYETSAYVSAYSKQKVYLEDEMNLNNSGFDWQNRRDLSIKFFNQLNINQDRGFLVNNQISYIYLVGQSQNTVNLDTKNMYLNLIFQNSECKIYQVQR
jgi:hypothetical protein